MQKKTSQIILIIVFFLAIIPPAIYAQTPPRVPLSPVVSPPNPFTQKLDYSTIATVDANGRPFVKLKEDVVGSPFFLDGFRKATIILTNGTKYKSIDLLIDEEKHEIHVVYQGHEIVVADGSVKEFSIVDTLDGKSSFYLFRSGYPAIEKNSMYTFYQVQCNGKLTLLRYGKKQLSSSKDPISGQESSEYKSYESHYLFQNGKILELKKDKVFLTSLMADQADKVGQFIKDQKVNFKKISSITELINYYNSL